MCSLDSFPGSDVPGEYMLVETNPPCISIAASTGVERLHDGSVSDVSKTELIYLPRFRLSFFLLVLTIVGCSILLGWCFNSFALLTGSLNSVVCVQSSFLR